MHSVEDLAAEISSLTRRMVAAESVLAVQALKARYGALVDQRFAAGAVVDADALAGVADRIAALFTVDGVWDGGPGLGTVRGRDAIATRLRQTTLVFSRHFFLNPRISVDESGVTATATWDLLSPCRRADGSSFWMCGFEDDEYANVDGTWLHRSMKLTTVFMTPTGEGWTRILA
jgi:hypothetical protein